MKQDGIEQPKRTIKKLRLERKESTSKGILEWNQNGLEKLKTETAVLIKCLWYSLHVCQYEGTKPLQMKAIDGNMDTHIDKQMYRARALKF